MFDSLPAHTPEDDQLQQAIMYGHGIMPSIRQVPMVVPLVCVFKVAHYNAPEAHPSTYKWPEDRTFYLESVVDGVPRYSADKMN